MARLRTFTNEDIIRIEERLRRGDRQQDIATAFGVNQGRISEIKATMSPPLTEQQAAEVVDAIEFDPVNHPQHYARNKIEPVHVTEDWGLDYFLGTALKYICRRGNKNGEYARERHLQDLKKAEWYLQRCIANFKGAYPELEPEEGLEQCSFCNQEVLRACKSADDYVTRSKQSGPLNVPCHEQRARDLRQAE